MTYEYLQARILESIKPFEGLRASSEAREEILKEVRNTLKEVFNDSFSELGLNHLYNIHSINTRWVDDETSIIWDYPKCPLKIRIPIDHLNFLDNFDPNN